MSDQRNDPQKDKNHPASDPTTGAANAVEVADALLRCLLKHARRDGRVTDVALILSAQGELDYVRHQLAVVPAPPEPITIVNHLDVHAVLNFFRNHPDAVRHILQREGVKQREQPEPVAIDSGAAINWLSRATPEAIRAALDVAGVNGHGFRTRPPYNGGFVPKMLGERNGASENPNHPASAPQPVQWNVTVRGNEDIEAILFGIRAHRDWSKISVKLVQPYPDSAGACAARFAPPPQHPEGTLIVKPNQVATFTFGEGWITQGFGVRPHEEGGRRGFFEFSHSDTHGEQGSRPESVSNNPAIEMEFVDTAAVLRLVRELNKLAVEMAKAGAR